MGGADPVGLRRPLSEDGENAVAVLQQLALDADPGLVASAGPRYFGFVVGGSLPVAVAAEVAAAWVLELLGLPASADVGFVTGAQMANFSCLAAARGELLHRTGWDVDAHGLFGAPPVSVLVGDEVHVTLLRALPYLGFGHDRVTRVSTDANGAMDPDALEAALRNAAAPVLVCAQAGNVNTGACDPLGAIADLAAEREAWLHVDGAFGPPRPRTLRGW